MAKATELAEAVGKEVISAAKSAITQTVKEGTQSEIERKQEIDELLSQAVASGDVPVVISVSRKGSEFARGDGAYLGNIEYVSASTLAQVGVKEVVKEWSGGGFYKVVITVPSLNIKKETTFSVEGEMLLPLPDREKQKLLPQGGIPGVGQGWRQVPGSNPWAGMPGAALSQYANPALPGMGMPGMPGFIPPGYAMTMGPTGPMLVPMPQQQPAATQPQTDPKIESRLEALAKATEAYARSTEERLAKQEEAMRAAQQDQRIRELEAKRDEERKDFERRMEEERRRNEDERRRMDEKLAALAATPKENPTLKMIESLAPLIAPLIPTMLERGDKTVAMMSETFKQMSTMQKDNTDTHVAMLTKALERPGPEDRVEKMAAVVQTNLASTVGIVSTLIQGVLSEKAGPDGPWYAKVLEKLIDTGGGVAGAILSGGMEDMEGEEGEEQEGQDEERPAPQRIEGKAEVISRGEVRPRRTRLAPPPGMTQPHGLAEGEAQEQPQPAPQEQEQQQMQSANFLDGLSPEQMAIVNRIHLPNLDSAMNTIVQMICTDGDAYEIAFRLWKHAASNIPAAIEWFNHPEDGSAFILGALRHHNEITVSDERIMQVAGAIREFYEHLLNNGAPEDFLASHKIQARMPRRMKVQPVQGVMSSSGQNTDTFGEGRAAAHEQGKRQPAPSAAQAVSGTKPVAVPDGIAETPMPVKPPPGMVTSPQEAPPSDADRLAAMSANAHKAAQGGAQPQGPTEYLPPPPPKAEPAAAPPALVVVPDVPGDKPVAP